MTLSDVYCHQESRETFSGTSDWIIVNIHLVRYLQRYSNRTGRALL